MLRPQRNSCELGTTAFDVSPLATRLLDTLAQHFLTNHGIYIYHCAVLQSTEKAISNELPEKISLQLDEINELL